MIVPQPSDGTLVPMRLRILVLLASVGALALSGSGGTSPVLAGSNDRQPQVARIVSVGDIACDPKSPYIKASGRCQHDRVGALVRRMVDRGADRFITLGDAQYETAKYRAFRSEFHPAFRAVRSVTKAIAGNHEYYTDGARGHFRYWGKRAGTRERPWRTFTPVSGWRVLLLDSNCERVGGCGPDSRQGKWLKSVLDANRRTCTVAMWHHPLQTSGEYAGDAGSRSRALPLWTIANAGGVDVVLNGHDHIYERFAKRSGIQEFVVGTGGKSHYDFTTKTPGSKKRIGNRYGVLRLDLMSNGKYKHAFVTPSGKVLDEGTTTCTNRPRR